MTYDDIQLSIAELRAELAGCVLTRAERTAARAQLEELTAQATALFVAIQQDPYAES